MEFKNYEINLFECKNNHSKNNISYNYFNFSLIKIYLFD